MVVDDLTLALIDPDTVDSSFILDDEEGPKDNTFLMGLLRCDCEELLDEVERIVRISGNIKFYNTTRQQIQKMTILLKHM